MAVRTNNKSAFCFALLFGLAACGSGRSGPAVDGGHSSDMSRVDFGPAHDSGPGVDTGVTPTDLGTAHDTGPTTTDAGRVCIAHCAINFDCQSSCPMSTGRVQCCDVPTGHCFAVTGSVCPASGTDAGSATDMGAIY